MPDSTRCQCVNKSKCKMHRSLLPNHSEHYNNHNVFSNVSMEEFETRSAQKYAHQYFSFGPPQHGHLAVAFVVIIIAHDISQSHEFNQSLLCLTIL